MYTVCITFADGSREQYFRSMMDREEYGHEMKRWEKAYTLEVTHVDELSHGDRFIFATAIEKKAAMARNLEQVKSRARYYSKMAEMERV